MYVYIYIYKQLGDFTGHVLNQAYVLDGHRLEPESRAARADYEIVPRLSRYIISQYIPITCLSYVSKIPFCIQVILPS